MPSEKSRIMFVAGVLAQIGAVVGEDAVCRRVRLTIRRTRAGFAAVLRCADAERSPPVMYAQSRAPRMGVAPERDSMR